MCSFFTLKYFRMYSIFHLPNVCAFNNDLFTYKELMFKHYGEHRCIKRFLNIMSFQSRKGVMFTNNNTKH